MVTVMEVTDYGANNKSNYQGNTQMLKGRAAHYKWLLEQGFTPEDINWIPADSILYDKD